MVFYAFLPIVLGLFLAALLSRIRIRGLTAFRLLLFLPLVITDVATAVAWTWVYDVERPAQHASCARSGSDGSSRRKAGSATSTPRCPRSACSACGGRSGSV